jgi:thiamine biosynthesis lipoprotein
MSADPTALPVPWLPEARETPPRTDPSIGDVPRRAWVEQIMGMPISVHLRGPGCSGEGRPRIREAVEAVFADLRAVDARLSRWKPDSELNRLRRGELTLDACHPEVRQVHRLCLHALEITDGWFDAWLPGPGLAAGAGRTHGPGDDRLFDPTGLVKGWAVERAARHLATLDGHDHLVNAGGDITVSCRRTDTPDWQVGVEDPRDGSRTLLTVPLRVGAVATSGTAARGEHIIDPTTGTPATRLAAVTVIGPELVWADVHATAAFAQGPASRVRLAGLAEHAAVLVSGDGTVTTTS